jgi:uroporphyrinogen-III synthase
METKRILVSRNLAFESKLRDWANAHQFQLIELPFIRIDPILNVEIPATEWVFFSSPNGLDVYFENYPLLAKKIGVYGAGTLLRLEEIGMSADFVGDTSKTPKEIGVQFFESISEPTSILFPQSQLSKKSISSVNKVNTCIEKVIYETSLVGQEIGDIDFAILTSPSNIDGFLLENKPMNTHFIVLGETSKKHFERLGISNKLEVPTSADESSVILLLERLLNL